MQESAHKSRIIREIQTRAISHSQNYHRKQVALWVRTHGLYVFGTNFLNTRECILA